MKFVALFMVFAFAAAYSDYYKLPYLDIVALVSNPAEMQAYAQCYVNEAPCTEVMEAYKRIVPEVVQTACLRCSPDLKYKGALFFSTFKNVLPNEYAKLRLHFDPENRYFDKFEEEIYKYLPNVHVPHVVYPF